MIDADHIKASVSAVEVAQAHGLKLRRAGADDRHVGLCPFHEERTGSFVVWPSRFHCFGCGSHGTNIDLEMRLTGVDFVTACDLLAHRHGLLVVGPDGRASTKPAALVRAAPAPKSFPPTDEVAASWSNFGAVDADPAVADFLRSKAIEPDRVVDCDLARAVSGPLPGWAFRGGEDWRTGGYALVVRMFDADGEFASLHARAVVDKAPDAKVTSPLGFTTRGAIMADSFGRALLAGKGRDRLLEVCERRRADGAGAGLVIAEGITDWLSWATSASDGDEDAPAVWSIISGSWTEEIAARVPDGATVCVSTDNDAAGARYARDIFQSLRSRVEVTRWTP